MKKSYVNVVADRGAAKASREPKTFGRLTNGYASARRRAANPKRGSDKPAARLGSRAERPSAGSSSNSLPTEVKSGHKSREQNTPLVRK